MNFESLFVNPNGRTSRAAFIGALVPLVAAAALYYFLVPIYLSRWMLFVLLFPAFVLHARRLHDMGWSAWLLLLPGAAIAAAIGLGAVGAPGQPTATLAAIALGAGFALWALAGNGQADANRYGKPAGR